EHALGRKITLWDEHQYNGSFQGSLAGDTIVYHSDAQSYAAVIYLTPDAPPEAGTRLVRSKHNKFRCVDEAPPAQKTVAARHMYDGKLLDPTAWETVDLIGNRYNLLALWNP